MLCRREAPALASAPTVVLMQLLDTRHYYWHMLVRTTVAPPGRGPAPSATHKRH